MRSQTERRRSQSRRRRLGQNFLIDGNAVERIVTLLDPKPDELLLEIGPGRGALTKILLERVGRLAAVELDPDLVSDLEQRFDPDRLALIHQNVLRLDLTEVARRFGAKHDRPIVIIGNLPYNISKPLAMKLVNERSRVDRAVLMFQREVIDRITATPGTRAYGAMSVLVGSAYRVETLFHLRPGSFRPRPKVVSTVSRWRPNPEFGLGKDELLALRACLAASFAHRRRTLHNNLRTVLPGGDAESRRLLRAAQLEGSLRPGAIPPEGFLRMAAIWPETTLSAPGGEEL